MKYPWQLYHWHFEVSGKCALKCPRCPRNDADPVPWINKELTLEFFKKLLTPDLLKNTVKRITMCGDVGDPIYASEYLDIVAYMCVSTVVIIRTNRLSLFEKSLKISNPARGEPFVVRDR